MEKEHAHIYETIILKDNEVDEAAFEKGSFCMKPHTEFVLLLLCCVLFHRQLESKRRTNPQIRVQMFKVKTFDSVYKWLPCHLNMLNPPLIIFWMKTAMIHQFNSCKLLFSENISRHCAAAQSGWMLQGEADTSVYCHLDIFSKTQDVILFDHIHFRIIQPRLQGVGL